MPPSDTSRRQATARTPDFADRIRRLRRAAESGRDGVGDLLISNPLDVAYLTGFLGGDSYLLVGHGRPTIISDFRYQEELADLRPRLAVHIRRGAMTDAVADVLGQHRVRTLGVQAEHMTLAARRALAKAAKGVRLVETTGLVAGLRAVKDEAEVAWLRRAVAIGEASLLATLPMIGRMLGGSRGRGGGKITEALIAARLEAEMKARGSSAPSFETIVAAGRHGSLPHYRPGMVRLGRNQPLLIDWGATWRGYHGDMTRTLCWGRWPARLRDAYRVVHEAHRLAAETLGPGRTTVEVDGAARRHIASAGLGKRFGHGTGHGIGLNIHEDPRLSHMTPPVTLVPGHVVTIEPGVYLPGLGGIRLENDYLVTARGCECLCTLPMTLDWATR